MESGLWWDYVIPYCSKSMQKEVCTRPADSPPAGITKVHTVWYEDLILDPVTEMLKIAAFLEVPLHRAEEVAIDGNVGLSVEDIVERCSFSAMKAKEVSVGLVLPSRVVKASAEEGAEGNRQRASKSHIRKGGVGGWKDYFNEDQNRSFDVLHAEQMAFPERSILLDNIRWE